MIGGQFFVSPGGQFRVSLDTVAVEYMKYTPALVPLDGSTNVHMYSETNGCWHKLIVVNYGRFPE